MLQQPEDWTEPGAHLVTPGVHRIPLPLPSVGLRAVNVYVIEDPAGLVLVDSGWAGPDGEGALADGLRRLGHRPSDVACVLVTHAHHDHYTQALALRTAYGTRVLLGRGEAPSVEAYLRSAENPASQPVTGSVHTRVDELLVHHEEGLAAALAEVRVGAETAYAVAARMPWTRRSTRIDELETQHAALAVLEIDAHLDVLIEAGELVAAEVGGVRRVALA